MEMKFKIGDLVWAKMKSYPPWPGIVSDPRDEGKTVTEKKNKQFIVFYGSDSYAWIADDQLWPYVQYRKKYMITQRAPQGFKEAIDAIEEIVKSRRGETSEETGEEMLETLSDEGKNTEQETVDKEEMSQTDSAAGATHTEDEGSDRTTSTRRRKRQNEAESKESTVSKKRAKVASRKKSESAQDKEETASGAADISNEPSLETSLPAAFSTFLPDILSCPKKSEGSSLKIGFLGLGNMGSLLVNRLLKSGHDVTVWNRTPSKCRDFVTQGAVKGISPSDVVQMCDITFSCVSDSAALKDLVFGNCGVAQVIGPGKAFVDMSSLDVDTATEVHEAITVRGGRFLEAPIVGTLDADEEPGQLVIIAAGDASLYEDCGSMFNAVAKRTFYIGEVGSATCTKLVITMVLGTMIASLAEALSLGEKVGLQQEQILKILSLLPISSALNTNKGTAMIHRRFNPRYLSLEHMQRDLRLAVAMAEPVEQTVYVTTATNELFKKAKAVGYGDHDTAAIYRATE